MSVSSKRKR